MLLSALSLATLILVVGIGIWQLAKVRKARRQHEHSASGAAGDAAMQGNLRERTGRDPAKQP